MTLLRKETLKNGYYYSGYILLNSNSISQDASAMIGALGAIASDKPRIICMWDKHQNCFWSWEYEGNIKSKRKFCYLPDINDEINAGFVPVKEVIPRESDLF